MIDLWDLGEFDQKGTTRTKWGCYEDLLNLARSAHEEKLGLYFDAVLNHKAAADEKEKCQAIICDWDGTSLVLRSLTQIVQKRLMSQLKLMHGLASRSLDARARILIWYGIGIILQEQIG